MDIDLTAAASWPQAKYDQVRAYLESIDNPELLTQLEEWRNGGESKAQEWGKIEEAAQKVPASELAEVGKGTHLLKDEAITPRTPAKQSSSATKEDSE